MKRNIWSNLILVSSCLILFSCKAKKIITSSSAAVSGTSTLNKAGLLDTIIAHQTNFKTFVTRANTNLKIDDKSYDVTLNIRIKKDEAIWISITAVAGIEVARVMITPDSLKVIDRMNDEYLKKPFSFIEKFTNPQVNYATVEALLVGNCVPLALADKNVLVRSRSRTILAGRSKSLGFELTLDEGLKPIKTNLRDDLAQQVLNVLINNFENINEIYLPSTVNIDSKSGAKQIQANMEYNKTQLDIPVDFPFNVPKRFSVIE
nr:DUF4292 domain-containing protein [Pseudopedobacter sp.]